MHELLLTNTLSLYFANQVSLFEFITFFGSITFAIFVLEYILLFKTNKLSLYLKSFGLVAITVWTMKILINRIRPNGDFGSFPSGHTSLAFTLGMLIYLENRKRWPIFLFSMIIGLSRLILGLHYLSDVIFGALMSMLIVLYVFENEK